MPAIVLLIASLFLALAPDAPAADGQTNIHMIVPGFTVRELPVRLSNINNVRFAPDGRLTALGYDGRVWLLRDTDGDGLEDQAEIFWDQPTLRIPVGMAWTTAGLVVSSQGKVSLLRDTDGDGKADTEEVIAAGWPKTDVASGGVDATAVTLDKEGNVYFGLLVADYSNPYRLRKRKDLKPEEKLWLEARGDTGGTADEEVSLYDTNSLRGTIQKWNAKTKKLETVATGIRVPYTLAFNKADDLFLTDQEGETWCPNGNPLDELNHIIPGRNYGFPPRHEKWLPALVSEPPVVGFGPQHQSTCGLVFNEPHPPLNNKRSILNSESALPCSPTQGLFGPSWWEGDAIVTGESRGKLWRVRLTKTANGYVGKEHLIARLDMLTTDVAISPKGDLYVSCHSGPPDWGTGPKGDGKLFRISYTDPAAPQPMAVWATNATEVRVAFDKPIDAFVTNLVVTQFIDFGEYARAADRYEVLKPPYKVVKQQETSPRGKLRILAASIDSTQRSLALTTEPHTQTATYALAIPRVRAKGASTEGETIDLDYRFIGTGTEVERGHSPTSIVDVSKSNFVVNDWGRGKSLFFGQQLKCGVCHRVRGEGGLAGPDLSNLVSRDDASVLRDIKEPNAAINPDYVAHNVALRSGDELSGIIRAQDESSLKLATADGKEAVVRRSDVKELRASSVSLMPSGLLDPLKEGQVRDLLTFLLFEPPQRTKAEVNAVLRAAQPETQNSKLETLSVVLVASKQDHGPGEHDYPAWQKKWNSLFASAPGVTVSNAWQWPTAEQFQSANVIVFYYWNHDWSAERYAQLDAYLARGGGVVVLHAATIADKEPEQLAERLGLAAQPQRTKYLHCPFDLVITAPANHPITRGLPRSIPFIDEPYWPMIGDAGKVEVLATAEQEGKAWPMMWTFQKGKGRVFASILGHYSWTQDDPMFRILVLRGVAWAAGADIHRLEKLSVQGVDLRP